MFNDFNFNGVATHPTSLVTTSFSGSTVTFSFSHQRIHNTNTGFVVGLQRFTNGVWHWVHGSSMNFTSTSTVQNTEVIFSSTYNGVYRLNISSPDAQRSSISNGRVRVR